MKVTLIPQNVFNLDINGKVFKDMRITGELDGVREMKNESSTVTLIRNGTGLGGFIHAALAGGVEEDWVPVRGSPDIIEAYKADLIEQATCAHVWTSTIESAFNICVKCDAEEPKKQIPGGWFNNTGHMPSVRDQHIQYQLHGGSIHFCSNKDIKNLDWTVRPHPHDTDIVKWRFAA